MKINDNIVVGYLVQRESILLGLDKRVSFRVYYREFILSLETDTIEFLNSIVLSKEISILEYIKDHISEYKDNLK